MFQDDPFAARFDKVKIHARVRQHAELVRGLARMIVLDRGLARRVGDITGLADVSVHAVAPTPMLRIANDMRRVQRRFRFRDAPPAVGGGPCGCHASAAAFAYLFDQPITSTFDSSGAHFIQFVAPRHTPLLAPSSRRPVAVAAAVQSAVAVARA